MSARTPADSQRILKDARSAQRRFERIRRRHLPWGWPPSPERCDEYIGRFCLWHDDDDVESSDAEPPPDAPEVTEARTELIERLRAAADSQPGDDWIAGQLVRYLVEDGRQEEALRAARACRAASPGWCDALAGYALHALGRYSAAGAAFDAALRAMPEAERRRWTDLSIFLKGDLADRYRALDCDARDGIERRFWWLADPLWLVPGNDRRTEHFARWVSDRLQEDADSGFDIPWGSDLRRILIRYGWPVRWERVSPTGTGIHQRQRIVSYHHPESRGFLPPPAFVDEPAAIGPGDWPLDPERPRSSYAPAYALPLDPLEHQLARFRRGDSTLVVAALDLRNDPEWPAGPVQTALFLMADERASPMAESRWLPAPRAVFTGSIASPHTVFGLELLSQEEPRAARARYGLTASAVPPSVLSISDLLLLHGAEPEADAMDHERAEGAEVAEADRAEVAEADVAEVGDEDGGEVVRGDSLADVLPRARGSSRIRAGEALGLYWEVYGLGARPEELEVSLALHRTDKGFFRELAETVGLAERRAPPVLTWRERVPAGARVWARSLSFRIPPLSPGTYELRLRIATFGREPVTVVRPLKVER